MRPGHLDDADHAPIGEARHREVGDTRERRVVVERLGERGAPSRQQTKRVLCTLALRRRARARITIGIGRFDGAHALRPSPVARVSSIPCVRGSSAPRALHFAELVTKRGAVDGDDDWNAAVDAVFVTRGTAVDAGDEPKEVVLAPAVDPSEVPCGFAFGDVSVLAVGTAAATVAAGSVVAAAVAVAGTSGVVGAAGRCAVVVDVVSREAVFSGAARSVAQPATATTRTRERMPT
jgi:hypothetical protein